MKGRENGCKENAFRERNHKASKATRAGNLQTLMHSAKCTMNKTLRINF